MSSTKNNYLRSSRKIHRWLASVLFIFFFIIAITGFLLGWKSWFNKTIYKNQTKSKVVKDMGKWLPLDSLKTIAIAELQAKVPAEKNTEIDRVDIRPEKAYATFQFKNKYTVMLNAANGTLQQIDKKNSNIILKIHEGSLVDDWLGTEFFKKTYVSVMGLSFFLLTLTGFWLWFKTRQIKKRKSLAAV
jgi:uncharacterized iron-regulated membrane protein